MDINEFVNFRKRSRNWDEHSIKISYDYSFVLEFVLDGVTSGFPLGVEEGAVLHQVVLQAKGTVKGYLLSWSFVDLDVVYLLTIDLVDFRVLFENQLEVLFLQVLNDYGSVDAYVEEGSGIDEELSGSNHPPLWLLEVVDLHPLRNNVVLLFCTGHQSSPESRKNFPQIL